MDDELNPFTTSDTPFAAYLHMRRHTVIGMKPDPNDKKRMVYVFIKRDETPLLEEEFYNTALGQDFQQYFKSVREIFSVLKQNLNK